MNSRILTVLEFNKILALMQESAGSEITRERIEGLKPMNNLRMVKDALTETTEAVSVIQYKGSIPAGGISDISGILGLAKKGRILSMRDLLIVRNNLAASRTAKVFLSSDMPEGLRIIPEIASLLEPQTKLENDISSAIISEDEMEMAHRPSFEE